MTTSQQTPPQPKINVEKTVAARIVDLIQAEGIDTIFGIPDPTFVLMFRIAADRGMHVIAEHHEAAGAFMADAMTRLTGKAAIICGNEGPGVANMVPAAICASKEKVPVVFIAGQRPRFFDTTVRRGKFQYTPQPRFFEAAMKYVGIIEFPDQVDDIFHEAFRQALSGTPGPVYMEFPSNGIAEVNLGPVLKPEAYRLLHQQADPQAVEAAAELLATARMPVLLAGTAIRHARAFEALRCVAERLQCPVIPTWGGRGTLPDTHPQVLLYSTEPANAAIAAADVVLAVGTEIGETIHYGTNMHWAHGSVDRRWIYIERDPTTIGVNRHIDIPLVGDLRDVLPQLSEAIARRPPRTMPAELKQWHTAFETASQALIAAAPDTHPIHPGRMIREVTSVLPGDTVMISDGGATQLFAMAYHVFSSPDYLCSADFGHLGVGLPYAIGAQLAVGSGRRVCLITGDSALQFHLAELQTAVRKNLPLVIVVNSDGAWGMERFAFRMALGPEREVETEWGEVRFDRIAEGFGAYGEYVDRTAEIAPAVQRALNSGKTALVQVAVDRQVNAFEMPNAQEFTTWYAGGLY